MGSPFQDSKGFTDEDREDEEEDEEEDEILSDASSVVDLHDANTDIQQYIESNDLEAIDAVLSRYREPKNPSQLIPEAQIRLSPCVSVALDNRNLEVVRRLLDRGIHVDYRSATPGVARALETGGDTSLLELLLRHGWEIRSVFVCVESPVLRSLLHDESLVGWLLSHGADPGHVDRLESSMARAAQYAPPSMLRLLADHGGRAEKTDAVVRAAIGHAEGEPGRLEAVELLATSLGAPVNAFAAQFCDPQACMSFVLMGGRLTALHHAARAGKTDMVQLLLNLGADRTSTSFEGKTALDLAVEKGHAEVVDLLRS